MSDDETQPVEYPLERRRDQSDIDSRLDSMQQSTDRLTSAVTRLTNVIDRVDRIEKKADDASHVAVETSQLVVHNSKHIAEEQAQGEKDRARMVLRVVAAFIALAVLGVSGGVLIVRHNARTIAARNQTSREGCEARNASQRKAGTAIDSFFLGMEAVERANVTAPKGITDARITLYEQTRKALATTLPNCEALYPGTHWP